MTGNPPMPDDPTPDRDPPGPDADLIAYLDGELDGADAARVEDRLALDPAARSKAEAYKKTFGLLDYLPKPEPSPDFATRTLTKLQPALSASGLGATVGYTGSAVAMPARTSWNGAIAWAAAAVVAVAGGFGAHAGLRPFVDPPRTDDLLFTDHRVIDHLPLYLAADDLDFVRQLDDPDLFAPDPLAAPSLPRPDVLPDASPASREKLTEQFKAFPPARQQQLRALDQQLHDLLPADRDHLGRVLEGYAVWVDRLADGDRHELLSAPSATARLEVARRLREKTWRESLPARTRELLKRVQSSEERLEAVELRRTAERAWAEEWAIARRQWDTLHGPDRKPWPFSEPLLAAQVDEYVKTVLKVDLARPEPPKDLPASWRLTRDEYIELKSRHDAAAKDASAFWYGLYVYRLAAAHPYLPEPGEKPMVTDQAHLPPGMLRDLRQKGVLQLLDRRGARGKWPEFAVEVAEAARRPGITVQEALGPCRPGEFKPAVNAFLAEAVFPKLTPSEKEGLRKLEGRFPDYPRQVVELATRHDESIPGVMLPGKPSLWAQHYSLPPRKKK